MRSSRIIRRGKSGVKRLLRRTVTNRPSRTIPPSYWGLHIGDDGHLWLDGVSLHDLLHKWGSPLHVVNVTALARNARRYTQVPPGSARGCEVYYSYKTNPVPYVLSALHRMNVGAEVISAYELWLALRLGIPPDRIIYNGPVKSSASLQEAMQRGVAMITANHAEEIPVIADMAKQNGRRVRIGIRVDVDEGWSAQFGVPTKGGAALRAFAAAVAQPALDVIGIHAHRGGTIRTEQQLRSFVEQVLTFVDELRDHLKFVPTILDFGGSLATPSVATIDAVPHRLNRTLLRDLPAPDVGAALSIERHISLVVELVNEFFEQRSLPIPRTALEPGRGLTGDCQFLLASVHSLKAAGEKTYAILDAGINIAEPVRSEYHQILPVNRAAEPPARTYTVVGPTCTPADTLYPAVTLPELRAGDSIAIMDAGAYFVPFANSFSFPQPPIVAVMNGRDTLVRRGEQFEDLISLDVVQQACDGQAED